eukprot:15080921-Alexandrium_andersonii.AAC.1
MGAVGCSGQGGPGRGGRGGVCQSCCARGTGKGWAGGGGKDVNAGAEEIGCLLAGVVLWVFCTWLCGHPVVRWFGGAWAHELTALRGEERWRVDSGGIRER